MCDRCWRCWIRCVLRSVLICMLEAVNGVLLVLEVPDGVRCVLFCMLELVEGVLCAGACWR